MKWLTLNPKGQGLTEYGIILLLILGVGMGVYFGSGYKGDLKNMYETIAEDLNEIIGDTYDTGETSKKYGVWEWGHRGIAYDSDSQGKYYLFHKTSVSYKDDKKIGEVWWFINGAGYKEYKVDENNDGSSGMLQYIPTQVNGYDYRLADGVAITDTSTTYFKGTDGNIYQITYYADNPTGTTMTQYTGDASNITLVGSAFTGKKS